MTGEGKVPVSLGAGVDPNEHLVSRFLSVCKLNDIEPKSLVPKKLLLKM